MLRNDHQKDTLLDGKEIRFVECSQDKDPPTIAVMLSRPSSTCPTQQILGLPLKCEAKAMLMFQGYGKRRKVEVRKVPLETYGGSTTSSSCSGLQSVGTQYHCSRSDFQISEHLHTKETFQR